MAIGTAYPSPAAPDFDVPRAGYEDWAKYNRQYWLDEAPAAAAPGTSSRVTETPFTLVYEARP